jgi:hypothetical protein
MCKSPSRDVFPSALNVGAMPHWPTGSEEFPFPSGLPKIRASYPKLALGDNKMPFVAASAMFLVQNPVYTINPAGRSTTATCVNPGPNPGHRKQFGFVLDASGAIKPALWTVYIRGMEANIVSFFSNLQGKISSRSGYPPRGSPVKLYDCKSVPSSKPRLMPSKLARIQTGTWDPDSDKGILGRRKNGPSPTGEGPFAVILQKSAGVKR